MRWDHLWLGIADRDAVAARVPGTPMAGMQGAGTIRSTGPRGVHHVPAQWCAAPRLAADWRRQATDSCRLVIIP